MIKKFSCVLLLTAIFSLAFAETQVKPCEGNIPQPSYTDIVGCTIPPCELKKGSTAVMYMNFTALEQTDALKAVAVAHAPLLPIPIPYPLPQPDACLELTNTHCPLEKNEPAQYKLEMPILNFPEVTITLELYLQANEETGNRVSCLQVDCKVVA